MKRVLCLVSKAGDVAIGFVGTPADGAARADAALGVGNWVAFDVTGDLRAALGATVVLARERVETPDGTGRWRWRSAADVVKECLGETPEHVCPACDQPTADDKTLEVRRMLSGFQQQLGERDQRILQLEAELAVAKADATP